MSSNIRPYKIDIPDSAIERLKTKLSLATLPGETTFSNDLEYGAPLDDIKRLVAFWQTSYDWRLAEAKLNELPQFTTSISVDGHEDNLTIHFVHQKAEKPDSIPILFCHGWPGSFMEVAKILPLLTSSKNADDFTFHVVAPSLPNCGFSQRTANRGFGIMQHAEVCHKLMQQLGYKKYVTQAGDWGFFVTRAMGIRYKEHILASHLNFILTLPPSPFRTPMLVLQHLAGRYTKSEKAALERTQWYMKDGSGYAQLHSSKPHTPGFALADSPVALLAWIYEKLRDWTDQYPWTDEEVITWISIYHFSEAGAEASLRLYYEITHPQAAVEGQGGYSNVPMEDFMKWNTIPLGLSYFPKDVISVPNSWGRTLGPVVSERRHEEGGHFAAFEKPELLVGDVREMITKAGIDDKI